MKPKTGWIIASLLTVSGISGAEDLRHGQPLQPQRDAALYVPDLAALAKPSSSELRELVERFKADKDALLQFYSVPGSTLQLRRLKE